MEEFVSRPIVIRQEQIQLLQKQSDRMPWCSAYRVALARGHSNEESYLQSKYLRLAATYSGDKEVLFQFMTSDILEVDEPETTSIPISEENVAKIEEAELVIPEEIEEKKETISDIETTKDAVEIKDQTKEIEVSPDSGEGIKDFESLESKDAEEIETKEERESEISDLESESAADEKYIGGESEESKIAEKEDIIDFEKIVTYDPLKELEPLQQVGAEKEDLSFDYIAYNPEEELTKLIEEKEEQEEHNFLFWLNNIEEDKPKLKKGVKSPDHVQDLLDQFLSTKRNRPIQNREFYKAESKAEESEVDNMDVISETLVDLYIKQGHYSKAIKGCKKLSLQNPDKSAYFAARIKEIENKQS